MVYVVFSSHTCGCEARLPSRPCWGGQRTEEDRVQTIHSPSADHSPSTDYSASAEKTSQIWHGWREAWKWVFDFIVALAGSEGGQREVKEDSGRWGGQREVKEDSWKWRRGQRGRLWHVWVEKATCIGSYPRLGYIEHLDWDCGSLWNEGPELAREERANMLKVL